MRLALASAKPPKINDKVNLRDLRAVIPLDITEDLSPSGIFAFWLLDPAAVVMVLIRGMSEL